MYKFTMYYMKILLCIIFISCFALQPFVSHLKGSLKAFYYFTFPRLYSYFFLRALKYVTQICTVMIL